MIAELRWVWGQVRRLGFGRNPLLRPIDRLEAAVVLGALLSAVLMLPVAAGIGAGLRERSRDAAAARWATLKEVRARTLESAATPITERQVSRRVRVGWVDPAGVSHEGRTAVPVGTSAGSGVTVWLDPSGAITTAPGSARDSAMLGGAAGFGTALTSWLVIAGLARLAVLRLNRRRMRAWDREWQIVATRWRNRQS